MKVATWFLARLVGTPAAHAIAGDLAETIPGNGWRRRIEAWGIVLRLGTARLRSRRDGAPSPSGREALPPARRGGSFGSDVRFALRVFRAHPASTAVAVLSLGLGIGANAAIFSLLDNLLLRPIPVARPAELVTTPTVFSYPDYLDLAEASSDELTGLAAWSATSRPYNLVTDSGAWSMLAELTTGNYFDVIEVPAAAGRLLNAEDEIQERSVAVISHRLWETEFDSDPGIAGTEARVNGLPVVIVGVTSAGFRGTRVNRAVDLWLPLSLHSRLATGSRARLSFDSRGTQWLRILGRSRPDSGLAQARAALLTGARQILDEMGPSPYLEDFTEVQTAESAAVPRADEVSRFLTLMLTMVGAALLVACVNVANVLLTRTAERRRELGLRMALGAPRSRLVRQLLTESLLLGAGGGLVALIFARWTLASVRLLEIPGRILLADVPLHLNTATLGFTSLAALVCTVAFGVGPAIVGTRPDAARLSHGSTVDRRGWTGPTALATVQVALTLALVFSGGLFVRSLGTALDVQLGFEPRDVFVSDLDLGVAGYDAEAAADFRRTARASIESIPEVERAAWGLFVPVQRGMRMESFRVVGHDLRDEDPTDVALNYVSPGYFDTLGIDLLAGRPFGEADTSGGTPSVIVNETLASHFWPEGSAVGNRLNFPGPEGVLELEIVGVVADTKRRALREDPSPYIYLPLDQWTWLIGADQVRLAWREAAGAGATIDTVRGRIAALDPGLPMPGLRSLDAQLFDQAMPQRVGATLLGMFAGMALLLAAVGVYGVIAAAMASRVREIGIRRAVGARARDVAVMTLRRGLVPVLIGVPLGWLLALGVSRLIASFLPGLSPTDPATMATATLVVVITATVACLPPAVRVARRDPALVLRAD